FRSSRGTQRRRRRSIKAALSFGIGKPFAGRDRRLVRMAHPTEAARWVAIPGAPLPFRILQPELFHARFRSCPVRFESRRLFAVDAQARPDAGLDRARSASGNRPAGAGGGWSPPG